MVSPYKQSSCRPKVHSQCGKYLVTSVSECYHVHCIGECHFTQT